MISICIWCSKEYRIEDSDAYTPEFYCSDYCEREEEELNWDGSDN